jgi:peptidoglycan L-alanyl-D-glutamate endopeptidase CwlK
MFSLIPTGYSIFTVISKVLKSIIKRQSPMVYTLSQNSIDKLVGVKQPLVDVVKLAMTYTKVNFEVIHGLRTKEEECKYVAEGKSETLDSRHITGDAIDFCVLVNGAVVWGPISLYEQVADAFFKAAAQLNISIVYGGSWITLKDWGHFELNRKFYP